MKFRFLDLSTFSSCVFIFIFIFCCSCSFPFAYCSFRCRFYFPPDKWTMFLLCNVIHKDMWLWSMRGSVVVAPLHHCLYMNTEFSLIIRHSSDGCKHFHGFFRFFFLQNQYSLAFFSFSSPFCCCCCCSSSCYIISVYWFIRWMSNKTKRKRKKKRIGSSRECIQLQRVQSSHCEMILYLYKLRTTKHDFSFLCIFHLYPFHWFIFVICRFALKSNENRSACTSQLERDLANHKIKSHNKTEQRQQHSQN